jgi:hypothetical protein
MVSEANKMWSDFFTKYKEIYGADKAHQFLDHLYANPMVVQEKEDKMLRQETTVLCGQSQPTETEYQRSYLRKELRDTKNEQLIQLEREFGLTDDAEPRSVNEIKKRILAGDFMYSGNKNEDYEHSSPWYHIRWRNPKKKEDHAGFQKAEEELLKKYRAAKDEIVILPLEQGLAAKRAFEGQAS